MEGTDIYPERAQIHMGSNLSPNQAREEPMDERPATALETLASSLTHNRVDAWTVVDRLEQLVNRLTGPATEVGKEAASPTPPLGSRLELLESECAKQAEALNAARCLLTRLEELL